VGYLDAMDNAESISQHTAGKLFTHDFVIMVLAFFAICCAFHSLTPTLPIYLTRLGSNEREIGVLIGIFAVAALASRLFVGGALLKYRAKSVMMVGAFVTIIVYLALIVFRPFFPFLIVRFLQGVAFACLDTAALASIISVIPLSYRTRALGYLMLAPSLAMAVAAPLGMFIINQYSFTMLFLSCAGLAVCAFLMFWKLKGQKIDIPDKNSPTHSTSLFNLKIITPAITAFLHLFIWGALSAFFPLYAIQCGVTNPGLFFSAMAMMMVAGRLFGGRIMDTCNKEKFIVTFLPSMMLILIILSLSKTLPMFILVGAVWGIGVAFFVPIIMAYALEYSGSSDGAAVGTYRAIYDLGIGLGPVVMGIIIPLTGYRVMFLCLALICLINLCYFQFYVRKKGNMAPKVKGRCDI
jgi:predicted MFS family arabinose efflux permease